MTERETIARVNGRYSNKPDKQAAVERHIIEWASRGRTFDELVHAYRSNRRGLEATQPQFAEGLVSLAEQGFVALEAEAKGWRLTNKGKELHRLTRFATDQAFRPATWGKAKYAVTSGDEAQKAEVERLIEQAFEEDWELRRQEVTRVLRWRPAQTEEKKDH